MKTYRIKTANYLGKVEVEGGQVVAASDSLKWAIGKNFIFVTDFLRRRFGENFSYREYHV